MSRVLGLDYGTKTVGVAISDPLLLTAQGLEIIRREKPSKLRKTLARIDELIASYQADKIVLGYPKNMNGTEGKRCEETLAFKEMLENRTHLEVILWDERLSTVTADKTMMETGIRKRTSERICRRDRSHGDFAGLFGLATGISGRKIIWKALH